MDTLVDMGHPLLTNFLKVHFVDRLQAYNGLSTGAEHILSEKQTSRRNRAPTRPAYKRQQLEDRKQRKKQQVEEAQIRCEHDDIFSERDRQMEQRFRELERKQQEMEEKRAA